MSAWTLNASTTCNFKSGKGFSSPNAAYAAWAKDFRDRDYCAYLQTYSPKERGRVLDLTFVMVTEGIAFGSNQENLKVIKPRLKETLLKYFTEKGVASQLPPHQVRDPGGLFVSLYEVFPKVLLPVEQSTMHDVKEAGSTATGRVHFTLSGQSGAHTEELRFVREKSGWFIHEYRSQY